ncbi:MAG: hypothetical protein H7274_18715 [Rhodoferax sp.]|nr:hypothetical protein [Rhodoferax sp.]
MITVLFEGVQALADDPFVLKEIQQAAARDPLYGATVLIALGNTEGEIYRMVYCEGRRQTERIRACLRALKFSETPSSGSGYHYVFSR